MKIHVNLDEPYLLETKSSISFAIYWEHNNTFYPEENWVDFGAELPSFWTNRIVELVEQDHKEAEFDFMDGPYLLKAQYDHQSKLVKLSLERTKARYDYKSKQMKAFIERSGVVWEVSIDTLIKELILAIKKIYTELEQKNKLNKYKNSLENSLNNLNRCLSKVEAV